MSSIALAASLILYVTCSLAMMAYGLKAYYMVWAFARRSRATRWISFLREKRFEKNLSAGQIELPVVTTQLPIYNEYNVVEKSIRAIAAIDYPKDKHLIQILDDSTDETVGLVDRIAIELREAGHDIEVIRRVERSGFKAGALKHGMLSARGEFIAIFDADFVPTPDFLKRTLAQFPGHPKRALVQARWGHLNRDEKLLTKSIAIGIDGHFVIEQPARSWNGFFLNFNGTGGVWRREAIDDAGGWKADTLTEDLELSYRAQLKGWEIFLLHDLVVPAEIPSTYEAFKSQQFRWAKGSIQTAKIVLPQIIRSDLPLGVKLHAFLHLTQYGMHPCMLAIAFLSTPLLTFISAQSSALAPYWFLGLLPLLAISFGPSQLYLFSQFFQGRSVLKHAKLIPNMMLIGFGLSVSNTKGVIEALLGIDSPFVRTPKRGQKSDKNYRVRKNSTPFLETAMGLYTLTSLVIALGTLKLFLAPYLLLYSVGFLSIGIASLLERKRELR